MLRQTLSKLLSNKTLNTCLNTSFIQYTVSFTRKADRKYCGVGSKADQSVADETTKQADKAVAIFEKITRADALINLLSKEISSELRENIILNPDRDSKLRHIEITEDKIRLEYSQITPQFTKFASLMQASSQEQAQYPEFLVPTDAVNLTWCGGGATLVLNKRKTLHYLQHTLRALQAHEDERD